MSMDLSQQQKTNQAELSGSCKRMAVTKEQMGKAYVERSFVSLSKSRLVVSFPTAQHWHASNRFRAVLT